jgi:hypothetical protein
MEEQFETLESAHDFVVLLGDTVAEAKRDLACDLQRESANPRRLDALRLAAYNLGKLELHLNRSRRILNDLRTLRRLLFEERGTTGKAAPIREQASPASDLLAQIKMCETAQREQAKTPPQRT